MNDQKSYTKYNHNNTQGFSIVSVMVMASLLGVLAVGIMNMTKLQMKTSKNNQATNEANVLTSKIEQYLLDRRSCEQTIGAISLTGASADLLSVKDKDGNDIYSLNSVYGNNSLKIVAITLNPKGIATLDIANNTLQNYILNIKYKKTSKLTAQNIIIKGIKLIIQKNSNGIITCYSDRMSVITDVRKNVCQDIGGSFDLLSGTCDISTSLAIKQAACNTFSGVFDSATGACAVP